MKAPVKFSLILSLSLLLSSCSWFTKTVVETQYVYIPVQITKVQSPAPLRLSDISFDVVSYKNIDEFLAKNEKRNGVVVFVALDIREYEAMSTNVAELRRYIEQQMGIIEFYENAIDETNVRAEELNTVSETE